MRRGLHGALRGRQAPRCRRSASVWKKVGELAGDRPAVRAAPGSKRAVKSQLEDLAYFLRSYAVGIDASPARLQEVEDRLALLERLKKKHGPTLADVIGAARCGGSWTPSSTRPSERPQLDAELAPRRATIAPRRRSCRRRAGGRRRVRAALERVARDLAMTRTRCEVRFVDARRRSGWSERGIDEGEFYISPNPGEDLRPLARIASGGELSRIMLALKTLASTDAPGKTLIFDEVDAGIGGAVADVVGAGCRRSGRAFQVLCITHLPQIAAYGDVALPIAKSRRKDGER